MQAEQLQRVQEDLLAIRQSLEPLQKLEQKELIKDEPSYTKLARLESAMARLDKREQELLEERRVLGTQPEGEQWGTARDARPTLCGLFSILGPGD